MYQGKNKTACASQRAITDAFFRLLKDQSFDDISISEICKEAGVSRQTFYTLFEKKENILLYEIECHNMMNTCGGDQSATEMVCHYVNDHASFLKILANHENASLLYDSFYQSFSHVLEDYDAAFMAGGLLSVIEKTIQDGCDEEKTAAIIHHMFDSVDFHKKK